MATTGYWGAPEPLDVFEYIVLRYSCSITEGICATGSLTEHTLPNIGALIENGGQIILGTVEPITKAAVAHDGQKALVMQRKKKGELVAALLERLDNAIATATARASGQRVDEINKLSANIRYEM